MAATPNKKNKLTKEALIKKKANTKQTVGGVNTNVSVTKTQKEYYQKFVNLSVMMHLYHKGMVQLEYHHLMIIFFLLY